MSPFDQVLTLGVGEALFAVPVTSVQEILDMRSITRLPDAPAHVLGVIDVRGQGVAVMDLAALLSVASAADGTATRIVVLRFKARGAETVLGLRADRVFEVTELDGDGLEPLPQSQLLNWSSRLIAGLGRKDGAFVALLDLPRMFAPEDLPTNLCLAA